MIKNWVCLWLMLMMLLVSAHAENGNQAGDSLAQSEVKMSEMTIDSKEELIQLAGAIVEGLVKNRLDAGYSGIDTAQGSTRYYSVNNATRGTKLSLYLDVQEQTFLRPWVVAERGTTELTESTVDSLRLNMARAIEALMYAHDSIEEQKEYEYINCDFLPEDGELNIEILDYYDQKLKSNEASWDMMFYAVNDGKGKWIRDELYVVYRFQQMLDESGTYTSVVSMITDQKAVWGIAGTMQANGIPLQGRISEWIQRQGSSAEPEKGAEGQQVCIRESGNVNVRKKSNAESARVGSAQAGKTYPCLSIAENGWYEILLEDGTTGFISPKMATLL